MEPLSDHEMRRLIGASRFGHLGLASGGYAYVVPLYYGFDGKTFYFHSLPGVKDDYMNGTTEACFVVDQVASEDDWASVMAFGRLEEVRDTQEQLRAMEALMAIPLPPEHGFTAGRQPKRAERPAHMYKLVVHRFSGRHSVPAPASREERELAKGGM